VSEAAARLPSAIAALLATLALAWLAWRMYGAETARWLLLLLPTTVGMIGFSHAAATDMPFSGMLTIAMVCAAVVLRLVPTAARGASLVPTGSSTPWAALILFGFFLGLAVLAKGPAGIILCGGAVFFWAIFTKRWRDAFRLLHPAAIVAFCVTALPWYILCARRNPDFLRVFIIEHNFKRYLTPEFQHIQPFWFYGPIFLLALLPWTAVPVWTAITAVAEFRRTRQFDHLSFLFWTFVAFCLVFFSASKSKLPDYILPAVPAAFFAIGEPVNRAWSCKRRSLGFSLLASGALFLALSTLLDHHLLRPFHTDSLGQLNLAMMLLVLGFAAVLMALGLYHRNGIREAQFILAACVLWIIVPLYFLAGRAVGFTDHDNSSRYLSERILSRNLGPEVYTYKVNRSWEYGLCFYLHRVVPELPDSPPAGAYVVTSIEEVVELQRKGYSLKGVDFGGSANTHQNLSLFRVVGPRSSGQPGLSREASIERS